LGPSQGPAVVLFIAKLATPLPGIAAEDRARVLARRRKTRLLRDVLPQI
jgi:hypothetical protein